METNHLSKQAFLNWSAQEASRAPPDVCELLIDGGLGLFMLLHAFEQLSNQLGVV